MPPEKSETTSEPLALVDLFYGSPTTAETPQGSTEADEGGQTTEETKDSVEEPAESGEQTNDENSDDEVSEEPAEYEVTVDGASRKVTRSELIKGYQLESAATKKTMEAAEIRKAAEAKSAQAEENLRVLTDIHGELESLILGDTKGIDWDALRESDVSEYLRLKEVVDKRSKALSDAVAKRNELMKQKITSETIALHKALGWSDAAKEKADTGLIMGYLQEHGITDQVTNHKLYLAILDAVKYQKLQASKPAVLKEVRKAPKSTTPAKTTKSPEPKSYADLMYKT
jgi:hypothetical protein